MMKVIVPGNPVPKGRPRLTRQGVAYTPEKTREYEERIRASFLTLGSGREFYGKETPIRIIMRIYLPIAKSLSEREKSARREHRALPTGRPDLDNYIKALDALNSLAWWDDGQIVSISATKYYSDDPRMEIEIYPMLQLRESILQK